MNWKILGKSLLLAFGLFVLFGILILLFHYFPWAGIILLFIAVVIFIYNKLENNNNDYNDSDRMSWFSNDEKEEN